MLRRTKDQVLSDLPPKILQDVYVNPSPLQVCPLHHCRAACLQLRQAPACTWVPHAPARLQPAMCTRAGFWSVDSVACHVGAQAKLLSDFAGSAISSQIAGALAGSGDRGGGGAKAAEAAPHVFQVQSAAASSVA